MTQPISTRSMAELALARAGVEQWEASRLTDERKKLIREQALGELDQELSHTFGEPVSDLQERRQKIERMFTMIKGIEDRGGAIAGEGFYIRRRKGEGVFEIFRRGSGIVATTRVTRVMTLFTPEMFFNGIEPR